MAKHKKNRNKNQQQNQVTPKPEPATTEDTKKGIKAVPKWKDDQGHLLKLKRASFPYNRAGNLAYCDYRIEYWTQKKLDVAKKTDPALKLNTKKEKLLKKLEEINSEIKAAGGQSDSETEQKTDI